MHKRNEGHKKCSSRLSKLYLSVMSVVVRLKAGQICFPFPEGEVNVFLFYFFLNLKDGSGVHPASNSMGIGYLPWGQNNWGVKLKNKWSRTSTPPVCLKDVYRNSCSVRITYIRGIRESSRGTQSQFYCPIQLLFKILTAKHSEMCHLSYVVLTGRRRWHWWHWCSVTA